MVERQAAPRRLAALVTSALRRRPPNEERLAGALRALCPALPDARELLGDAASALARREAFERPLFVAAVRALCELDDPHGHRALMAAFKAEDGPGLGPLSAALHSADPRLQPPLLRASLSRHPHVAFAAELARLQRGESSGSSLEALALRIKEASRVALCAELFWPPTRTPPLASGAAPALAVLRSAERHLGRWLLLAELAVAAGDASPLAHARELAEHGPASARPAWVLISWALSSSHEPPSQRAPIDTLARLSDRPAAERDLSFLFRMAEARAPQIKAHLEGLAASLALAEENAIRAAFYLARDHGRDDLRAALRGLPRRKESALGLAAAALLDLGDAEGAAELADHCAEATAVAAVAWGILVQHALASAARPALLTELNYRRIHGGSLS